VPGSIEGTDKVYAATWAALLAVHTHNLSEEQKIEVVAMPAMGTGFGGVLFGEAARRRGKWRLPTGTTWSRRTGWTGTLWPNGRRRSVTTALDRWHANSSPLGCRENSPTASM